MRLQIYCYMLVLCDGCRVIIKLYRTSVDLLEKDPSSILGEFQSQLSFVVSGMLVLYYMCIFIPVVYLYTGTIYVVYVAFYYYPLIYNYLCTVKPLQSNAPWESKFVPDYRGCQINKLPA